MRNILLTIEYDGTAYAGWQVQPNGLSIQQVVETALEKMLQEKVRLNSSGRTDAGVHAVAMPACFVTSRGLPLKAFTAGLNSVLPPDIAVRKAVEVPLEFLPRREATAKHYRYTLHVSPTRSPLHRLTSWQLRGPLDVDAMRQAAGFFVGEHDFASFRGSGCAAKTTVRTVHSLEIRTEGNLMIFDVTGAGFLRNMVRIMVGTIVEAGFGRRQPGSVRELLERPDRQSAGVTAPAQGLSLVEVYFGRFSG
jgi:tRNA pseudouridine38-40 synthase